MFPYRDDNPSILTPFVTAGLIAANVAAAAAQIVADPASAVPMVGASGAVSGVMGAYVVLYPRVRVHCLVVLVIFFFRVSLPAWVLLGYWFVLQTLGLGVDSVGGVAFWAHVGGFLAGALLILLFRDPALMAKRRQLLAARLWVPPEGYAR